MSAFESSGCNNVLWESDLKLARRNLPRWADVIHAAGIKPN